MSQKRLRSPIIYLLPSLVVLFCLLPLGSSAQERVLFLDIMQQCDGSVRRVGDFANVDVELNGSQIDSQFDGAKTTLPVGEHKLRIVTKGLRGQDEAPIIKEIKVVHSSTGATQVLNPNSTEATVTLTSADMPLYAYVQIQVTLNICDSPPQKKENDISVMLASQTCKSPPVWEGLKVRIGETELDAGDLDAPKNEGSDVQGQIRTRKLKLPPGKHEITIIPVSFPKTTIDEVSVFRNHYSERKQSWRLETANTYDPDDARHATVELPENLWKKSVDFQSPLLIIKISGNCETPKTDPNEFGIVTVKAVSGLVEAKQPPLTLAAKKQEFPFIKAAVDTRYTEGTVIRTGVDGLIILESEYKHTITIDNSTEVKLSTLVTESGRRQLRALIEKGKIKIERESSGSTNDSAAGTTVETKTAIVNSTQTIYTVSYDETAKLTTVSVAEGEVEVFPTSDALQPITLSALQQVQIEQNKVGSVTAYTPESDSNKSGKILLYIGLALVSLLALAGLFYLFRRHTRRVTQVANYPVVTSPPAWNPPPENVPPPGINQTSQRCPNPQCGKESPAGEKLCPHCGARLNL